MAETTNSTGPGGFLPKRTLPSPAPSGTSTHSTSGLPHPRSHPLRAGSAKEEKTRIYVENQLMYIQRRYVKKFEQVKPDDDVVGYQSVSELCRDIEALVHIIWLSGTPGLQIPNLLNIAGEFSEWVTRFPPIPVAIFSLLRKLDFCFASLLAGHDIETKETLPGFENGARGVMTQTDKVRCRSIVEQTRVLVVELMNKQPAEENDEVEEEETDTEMEDTETEPDVEVAGSDAGDRGFVDPNWEDDDEFYMDVARVYERTLVQLGEVMKDAALP